MHPLLATRVFNTPLLITPEYGQVVTTVLADKLDVMPLVAEDVLKRYERPNTRAHFDKRSGIVTMPVVGGLVHRSDGPDALSGLQSYTSLHNRFESLFADDVSRGILVDLDSGGGEAAGLQELADWLPKASKQAGKPVWVVANTVAGSAAYWFGSAATRESKRFFAAHGSHVGSIGVYVQHVDMSKAVEKRGLVVSFVYAGEHKIDGHPFGPLPDSVRASMQDRVDKLYGDFVEAVASNRKLDTKVVRDTQARVYPPEEAYALGLVDGIGGLGSVHAAFADHLNRPFVGYTSGDTMSKELIYDQDALDGAKAAGMAAGKAESATAITELQSKLNAAGEERKALLSAFAQIGAGNPKVEVFVEALNEGGSVALATKMAAKFETPKVEAPKPKQSRTEADVDALMSAHAPNISADGGGDVDPQDAKAKRLVEITGSAQSYNKSKGYTA